jgi:hypothetical protein
MLLAISSYLLSIHVVYWQFEVVSQYKFKTYNIIEVETMRNQRSLLLIVATIFLFSFAAIPPADAFVATATIAAVLAVTFASTVFITETAIKPNEEPRPEHSESKEKTQDNLQALNEP